MGRFNRTNDKSTTNNDFMRVGSVLSPFPEEYGTALDKEDADVLRNLNCTLNLNFYFSDFIKRKYPEVIKNDTVTLRSKDRIRLKFTPPAKAKDFVVGVASLKVGDDEYVDLGNITVTKKTEEKEPTLANDLKKSGMCLTYQVWIPEETSLEVKNKDNHIINFRTWDTDKDFVLGHVSIINK